jgi:outer membrane protein insertion porin family
VDNVATNASDLIKAEEGSRIKSYGTVELIRDTRNSTFIPSRGFRGSASATLAGGPFGGDTDTYQFMLRASQYFPLWFAHVLNFRGMTSIVEEYGDSESVPIFDRLFLGGPRTVRGFKFRKVGPKDDTGEPIGGRSAIYGTVEYTLPVVDSVRFALFYDVGIVWVDQYKKSEEVTYVGDGILNDDWGIGVRFDFPSFPIQLDYAWPLQTDEVTSDSGRFSFSIGYTY